MPGESRVLILASTSTYRKVLLERLHLPFKQVTPTFMEATGAGLSPRALVKHNTLGKAQSVLDRYPDARVIASDQIAFFEDNHIGKPGNETAAIEQLMRFRGHSVDFLTGIALCTQSSQQFDIITTRVHFRDLSDNDIMNYVRLEQPLDCAGSFKSEGLGITLFEHIESDDLTALIGLPLIRLSEWLRPLAQH